MEILQKESYPPKAVLPCLSTAVTERPSLMYFKNTFDKNSFQPISGTQNKTSFSMLTQAQKSSVILQVLKNPKLLGIVFHSHRKRKQFPEAGRVIKTPCTNHT